MQRLTDFLTNALGLIAGAAMALMMIHVMADVVGKYAFSQPVPSTAEVVANYYMIAGVFLPLAWVEAKNGAIVVELFYDMVGPFLQTIMIAIGRLFTAAFYAGLGWFSWDVAMRAYRINETLDGIWRVTVWPAKFMLPLGLAIAVLVLLLQLVTAARPADTTNEPI